MAFFGIAIEIAKRFYRSRTINLDKRMKHQLNSSREVWDLFGIIRQILSKRSNRSNIWSILDNVYFYEWNFCWKPILYTVQHTTHQNGRTRKAKRARTHFEQAAKELKNWRRLLVMNRNLSFENSVLSENFVCECPSLFSFDYIVHVGQCQEKWRQLPVSSSLFRVVWTSYAKKKKKKSEMMFCSSCFII